MWARCGKSDPEVCVCYGVPITWPRVVFHNYLANELCFVLELYCEGKGESLKVMKNNLGTLFDVTIF